MLLGIQLGSSNFQLQDFHLLWCSFQLLRLVLLVLYAVPLPHQPQSMVWASPSSLAATKGIAFAFSSSGY